ncbi:MAG: acylphosphatase [Gemmatimonadota bacterium]|nr:acylphosphatase [Gemmatimonadota bacterium]
MDCIHLEIRGQVQGVGFRWFVRESARSLGLRGWVKNRPDGNVELAAAGGTDALREFAEAVGKGPRGAIVERVETLPAPDVESLPQPFTIVR